MEEPPSKPQRLKPLEFFLHAARQGQPDIYWGKGTIEPQHQEGGLFWASPLIFREGKPVGRLTIDGFPIDTFPFEAAEPVGRPPETAKHIAAWLAWHIYVQRERGKKGRADELTGERFGYKDPKEIQRIRNQRINELLPILPSMEFQIRLDESGQHAYAAYIEKPTYYLKDGEFQLLGIAWVWCESWGRQATNKAIRLQAKVENLNLDEWQKLTLNEGAILFTAS